MKHILIGVTMVWALVGAKAQTRFTISSNGPSNNRINITILGDGYTTNQQQQFKSDATNAFNAFLNQPVWQPYKTLFNAAGIGVASAQSGSDKPPLGIYRDTYFSSSFYSSGIDRLLTIPPNSYDSDSSKGYFKVYQLISAYAPETDYRVMLCNDTTYGGSGGGLMLVASLNSASPEIVKHEFGHSFAGLGDEYTTAYPGYPDVEEPNTTRQTNRALIKWNRWIDPTTPIPTPNSISYGTKVGLFQGAHYHSTGWYRPWYDCLMRTLGKNLCPVCAEQMIVSLYGKLVMIESRYPAQTNLTVAATNSFYISTVIPQSVRRARWYLNDVAVGENDTYLDLQRSAFRPGTNAVKLQVFDTNTMLRVEVKVESEWFVFNPDTPPAPPVIKSIKAGKWFYRP